VIRNDQKTDPDPGTCLFFICLQYYVKQLYLTIICISTTNKCSFTEENSSTLHLKISSCALHIPTYLRLNISKCFPATAVDVVNTKMFNSINQTIYFDKTIYQFSKCCTLLVRVQSMSLPTNLRSMISSASWWPNAMASK